MQFLHQRPGFQKILFVSAMQKSIPVLLCQCASVLLINFLFESAYAGPELPIRDIVNDIPLLGARCAAMGGASVANDNPLSDKGGVCMASPALLTRHAGKGSLSFNYTDYDGLERNGGINEGSFTIVSKKFWGESVFAAQGIFAETNKGSFPAGLQNRYEIRHKAIFWHLPKRSIQSFPSDYMGLQ